MISIRNKYGMGTSKRHTEGTVFDMNSWSTGTSISMEEELVDLVWQ